jgi:hypothetical protein
LTDQLGARRDHDLGKPRSFVEQRFRDGSSSEQKARCLSAASQLAACRPRARRRSLSAIMAPCRAAAATFLNGDDVQARIVAEIDVAARLADIRR